MAKTRLTALQAARKVMNRPMRAAEITERILERKLWRTDGKTPVNTVSRDLNEASKLRGAPIRKVAPGLYARRGSNGRRR